MRNRHKRNLILLLALMGGLAWVDDGTWAQEAGEPPMALEATYTVHGFSNVQGGLAQGTRFLDNFDIILTGDLDRLVGWNGATFSIYGLGNQGRSPSELIGDAQGLSNIDAPNSWRLYEAWIEQTFADGRVSVKSGLYDLNSEFDVIEAAGLFLNSSHGIGPDFSQTGLNGPSIFPITALAIRGRVAASERVSFQVAVLDGVPGDPDDPTGTNIRLSREDGALLVGEVGLEARPRTFEGELPYARATLGAYAYTNGVTPIAGASGDGRRKARAFGVYLLGEGRLYSEGGAHGQGATGYLRAGYAADRVNQVEFYLGGGLVYTGLFPGREADQFGIAVADAITGDRFRMVQSRTGVPVDRSEIAIEVTYCAELMGGLVLQPDLQYILNPGMDPTVRDALALGFMASVSF